MTKLEALNEERARLSEIVRNFGMMNTPTNAADRLKADVYYRLAMDAWHGAERAYSEELARTPADELKRLVGA